MNSASFTSIDDVQSFICTHFFQSKLHFSMHDNPPSEAIAPCLKDIFDFDDRYCDSIFIDVWGEKDKSGKIPKIAVVALIISDECDQDLSIKLRWISQYATHEKP